MSDQDFGPLGWVGVSDFGTKPEVTNEPATGARPVAVEVTVRLTALAIRKADGRYSIVVPALPGCVSEADTIDEVAGQVVDAAEGWLASMHESEKEQAMRDCLP